MRKRSLKFIFLFVAMVGGASDLPAADVNTAEATKVAKWWLGREIDGAWSHVAVNEKVSRRTLLDQPHVDALWNDGQAYQRGSPKQGRQADAYLITFPNGGFVVVSADDRMVPVIAFDATSTFVWEGVRGEAVRSLLSRTLGAWRKYTAECEAKGNRAASSFWKSLRVSLALPAGVQPIEGQYDIGPLAYNIVLTTANWDQDRFYNDTVQAHVGGDDRVPVGCVATAMAIFMRYFSWPSTGTGNNSYWDVCNGTNYFHSVTLGAIYNWSAMPLADLTSANQQVADLMYHCGVMIGMNYGIGASGVPPSMPLVTVMNNNFRYRGSIRLTSNHSTPIQNCIKALVPVFITSSTHALVVDGYRDSTSPYYHINVGWGWGGTWYNLDTLPGSDPTIDLSFPYGTPNHYAYVNGTYSGTENGALGTPYNTMSEGVNGVASGGQLWIKGGTYAGAMTINKAMTLNAYDGGAVLQ